MMLVDCAVKRPSTLGSTVAPEGEGMMAINETGEAHARPYRNVAVTNPDVTTLFDTGHAVQSRPLSEPLNPIRSSFAY